MKHVYVSAQPLPPVLPANEHSPKRCNLTVKKQRILYGCVLFFALLDGVLKILALQNKLPEIHTNIFRIAYFANAGIALSIPLPQIYILITTAILILILITFLIKTKHPSIRIALTSALLGAMSNFIDRLHTGHTTDYFIFFSRSAINIADVLIILGIGYCAWYYQKADVKFEVKSY